MQQIEENRSSPIRPREHEILLAHPLLFRAVQDPDPYRAPLGYWGLEIGDGWLEIVNEAADAIEKAVEAEVAAFDFRAHVNLLDRQQFHYIQPPPRGVDKWTVVDPEPAFLCCMQIKEKSGSLSIYIQRERFPAKPAGMSSGRQLQQHRPRQMSPARHAVPRASCSRMATGASGAPNSRPSGRKDRKWH